MTIFGPPALPWPYLTYMVQISFYLAFIKNNVKLLFINKNVMDHSYVTSHNFTDPPPTSVTYIMYQYFMHFQFCRCPRLSYQMKRLRRVMEKVLVYLNTSSLWFVNKACLLKERLDSNIEWGTLNNTFI